MRKLFMILIVIVLNLLMVSCEYIGSRVITEGDFVYTVYPKKVMINELSEEGKEKSSIYVPLILKSKPVIALGFTQMGQYHFIRSNTVTHLNLSHTTQGYTTLSGIPNLKSLVFSSVIPFMVVESDNQLFQGEDGARIYIPKGSLEGYQTLNKDIIDSFVFIEVNISYMYNFEDSPNGGYYMVDARTINQLVYEPINPVRKGYTFKGWYIDDSYQEMWDFGSILDVNELTLYAKWEVKS